VPNVFLDCVEYDGIIRVQFLFQARILVNNSVLNRENRTSFTKINGYCLCSVRSKNCCQLSHRLSTFVAK
jgi:hypothetical protein